MSTDHRAIHRRHSIRLPGYDYTQEGAYFLTICTYQRESLFGVVENGEMRPNQFGEMVIFTWNDLPTHIPGIELGPFVVMPDHIHGIVWIGNADLKPGADLLQTGAGPQTGAGLEPGADLLQTGAGLEPAPTDRTPLSEIVRQLKTFSARRINGARRTPGSAVWQRNYYEHVIRNDAELDRICAYIINNPRNWEDDTQNPGRRN